MLPRAGEGSEIARAGLGDAGLAAVAGAEVTVEMISPFEPARVLASGRTDEAGWWRQRLQLPVSVGGLAALIVAVRSPLGDAEEKILL